MVEWNPRKIHGKSLHNTKVTAAVGSLLYLLLNYIFEEVIPQVLTTCSVNAQLYHNMLKTYAIASL